MGSVNLVVLVGSLGRDAEATVTTGGTNIARFSMATNYKRKDQDEKVEWHRIVLIGREGVVPYLKKGSQVAVTGRIETRSWDDKDGQKKYMTEIIADQIQLLGGGSAGASRGGSPRSTRDGFDPSPSPDDDEDTPF